MLISVSSHRLNLSPFPGSHIGLWFQNLLMAKNGVDVGLERWAWLLWPQESLLLPSLILGHADTLLSQPLFWESGPGRIGF